MAVCLNWCFTKRLVVIASEIPQCEHSQPIKTKILRFSFHMFIPSISWDSCHFALTCSHGNQPWPPHNLLSEGHMTVTHPNVLSKTGHQSMASGSQRVEVTHGIILLLVYLGDNYLLHCAGKLWKCHNCALLLLCLFLGFFCLCYAILFLILFLSIPDLFMTGRLL